MAVNAKITVLLNERVDKIEPGAMLSSHKISWKQDPVNPLLYIGEFKNIAMYDPYLYLIVHGVNGFTCEVNLFINNKKYNTKPVYVKVDASGNGHYNKLIPKK